MNTQQMLSQGKTTLDDLIAKQLEDLCRELPDVTGRELYLAVAAHSINALRFLDSSDGEVFIEALSEKDKKILRVK